MGSRSLRAGLYVFLEELQGGRSQSYAKELEEYAHGVVNPS
jgi:hypothetical protein